MQCINVPFPVNIIPHTSCLMQSIHISSSSIHPKDFRFRFTLLTYEQSFLFIAHTVIHANMNKYEEFMEKTSPQSRQYHHRHHHHSFRCHIFLEKSIQPNHVSTHITTSNYTFCASFQLFPLKSMWITWRSTFRFTSHVCDFIHFFPSSLIYCHATIHHTHTHTRMHGLYFWWCSAN